MPPRKGRQVNLMRRLGRSCHLNLPAKKWDSRQEGWKHETCDDGSARHRGHRTRNSRSPGRAGSTGRSETILSQDLSESSLASGNHRHVPSAPSACTEATAHLNRGPGTPPIAHLEATEQEAACAWDGKIRIEKQDRIVVPPARNVTTIVTGALLSALALFIGWTGALNSDPFTLKSASLPVKTVNLSAEDRPAAAKPERLASASTIVTAPNSAHETSKPGAQTANSLLTKQAARAPQSTAVERTKVSTKPAPVPETRPTTIEGWTIREVSGGTAVLVGPNGVWNATRGDLVPGVGKIYSIVRWGNRWIVATSRGLISTR
jgi:hypothetical protein